MNAKQKYAQGAPECGARSKTFIGIRYQFENSIFNGTCTVGGVNPTAHPIPAPCRKFEVKQSALREKYYNIPTLEGSDSDHKKQGWFEIIKKATDKATNHFAENCNLGAASMCIVRDTPEIRLAIIESTEVGIAEIVKLIELAKGASFQKYVPATTPSLWGDGDGYVYLMADQSNGHTKIGKSCDPGYREKTLRSDKKEIRLLYNKRVLIMKHTEDCLHERFKDKRLEGEWFDLSKAEIEEAKLLIKRATHETL